MDEHVDVIVVGLGSMGSAAAAELAGRGLSVLGLEQFGPAHDQGSAHGSTRIVRQSYFEGAAYVPLLRRAYEGWADLQEESGRDLFTLCGGLYLGDPDSAVVSGSLASATVHGLDHELLDAAAIRERFSTMQPREHVVGLYEANAGFVRPEETVLGYLDLATRRGADLHFDEAVRRWTPTAGGGVEVVTTRGSYAADRLVLAPGAWAPDLLPDPTTLVVERQLLYWFAPDVATGPPYEAYASPDHPVFIDDSDGLGEFYGFPMVDGPDGGLKVARYRQNDGATTTPQTVDRTVHPHEVADVRGRALTLFPHLTGPLLRSATCFYCSAADDAFALGTLPTTPQVTLAAGFSGHGFKFVPVIGQIVADLVQDGTTSHDIALFDLTRDGFTGSGRVEAAPEPPS